MTDDASTEDDRAATNTQTPWGRRLVRPLLSIAGLGIAIHVIYPQLGELSQGIDALTAGRWPWLAAAFAASGSVFLASAWTVRATVDGEQVRWVELVFVQVGAGFVSSVTPLALGGAAANQSYLVKRGVSAPAAAAAVGLNLAATFLSHGLLLVVLLPFAASALPASIPLPPHQTVLEVAIGVFAIGAIIFWLPRSRRTVLDTLRPMGHAFGGLVADPRRGVETMVSVVVMNLAFGVALWTSAKAFGVDPGFVAILEVYLVAAVIGAVSPTPGGLGPMEAALIAGLGRLGIPAGESVAIALTFRIVTYWVPMPIGAVTLGWLRRRGMV